MGRSISPAAATGGSMINVSLGTTSPMGQHQHLAILGNGCMRPNVSAVVHHKNAPMPMKAPQQRFLQQTYLQQQPMFSGMDPRMVMMMNRNLPGPSVMIRGHLQPFRPRFM